MERLEKWFKEKKGDLDEKFDTSSGWNRLEQRMNSSSSGSDTRFWYSAAAVFVGLLISLGVVQRMENSAEGERTSLPHDIVQAEMYFTGLIEIKTRDLKNGSAAIPELRNESDQLLNDLIFLDSAYNELKMMLINDAENEIIKAEMVRNLQIRVNILTRQIEILNTYNNNKNESSII